MTALIGTFPLTTPLPSAPPKKKRLLLLDTSAAKRDLRAEVMRRLGIEVDCAADISEARCWWRADLYDLVLIDFGEDRDGADKFCADMRGATPPQQLAFLVGGPEYLAASPNPDGVPADSGDMEQPPRTELTSKIPAATIPENPQQRWGILEASRRISAVRSVSHARSRALRERDRPSRWAEAVERHSKQAAIQSQPLSEIARDE